MTSAERAFEEWYAPKANIAAEVLPRGFAKEMVSLSLQAWRAACEWQRERDATIVEEHKWINAGHFAAAIREGEK